MSTNKGGVQCLVWHRRRGNGRSVLEVDEDALIELEAISKKLVVIGIIGRGRSGKSYLLNSLFSGKKEGFDVGHKVEPKTNGIWMHLLDHPNRETHQLLILDTEGYGKSCEVDAYMEEMIQAITLSVSSTIIVNGQRMVEEPDIEKLALFTDIAKHIISDQQRNELTGPFLVYLVHNFTLKTNCSDDEYLHSTLKVDNREDTNTPRAAVRLAIDRFFSNRMAFLLHSPVRDCRNLNKLTDLNDEELCSSFKQKIGAIREVLITQSPPMSSKGRPVRGKEWSNLLRNCVEKANSKTIPISSSPYEVFLAGFAKSAKKARYDDPIAWIEQQDPMEVIIGNANIGKEAEVQQIVECFRQDLRLFGQEQFAATTFSRDWFAISVFGKSGGRMTFSDESVTVDVAPEALEIHSIIYCYRGTFSRPRQNDVVFYSIPLSCGPEDTVLRRPVQLTFRHSAEIGNRQQEEQLKVYTRSRESLSFRHDETVQIEIEEKWAIVRMMKLCDVVVGATLPT